MRGAALAATLIVVSSGCAGAASTDPVGAYVGMGEWAAHSLTLGADGSFHHAWRDDAGPHSETGRWVVSSRNGYRLAGDRCRYLDFEAYSETPARRTASQACAISNLGERLLIFNGDRHLGYRKL